MPPALQYGTKQVLFPIDGPVLPARDPTVWTPMTSDVPDHALDGAFFDGRLMVEIREWNWHFHLALSHPDIRAKYRFQRGLSYSRSIEIFGAVRAPHPDRGKLMRIWLSPFGPKITFGRNGLD